MPVVGGAGGQHVAILKHDIDSKLMSFRHMAKFNDSLLGANPKPFTLQGDTLVFLFESEDAADAWGYYIDATPIYG